MNDTDERTLQLPWASLYQCELTEPYQVNGRTVINDEGYMGDLGGLNLNIVDNKDFGRGLSHYHGGRASEFVKCCQLGAGIHVSVLSIKMSVFEKK
jgi:hypothetical protein